MYLPAQPSSREAPIAFHRLRRDGQNLGSFFFGVTAKEPEFHDTGLTGISLRQLLNRLVDRDQFVWLFTCHRQSIFEGHPGFVPCSLGSLTLARMVHQNPTHLL